MSSLEFKEIFNLSDTIFIMLDTDNNGLVDMLEVFSALALLSESRVEDKIRCKTGLALVLFEIYDFNESNELDQAELQFMLWSSI